jgi:hypothetical protein
MVILRLGVLYFYWLPAFLTFFYIKLAWAPYFDTLTYKKNIAVYVFLYLNTWGVIWSPRELNIEEGKKSRQPVEIKHT